MMYKFSEARMLSGLPSGVDDLRWTITIIGSHDEEMEMQRKYPNWDKTHTFIPRPDRFARFLAKIAFGYFVAEYGLDNFTPFVVDVILGRSTDHFYAVGGSFDIPAAIPGGDHIINIAPMTVSAGRALIRLEVRLFSAIETPTYHVIVGEIDFKNPQHVSAFEEHRRQGKVEVSLP